MIAKTPIIGMIFIVGLALVTVGAGYYTVFLLNKANCPATPQNYTVNVTLHQWGFLINGTDATKNGWSICHGSIVTFILRATWEHNGVVAGGNFTQHGFRISGIFSGIVVNSTVQPITTPPITFDTPGQFVLQCFVFCGESGSYGFGGHSTMRATINVI
jgi:heme/copper-type cytochrome/quinol oxidase subunit 2